MRKETTPRVADDPPDRLDDIQRLLREMEVALQSPQAVSYYDDLLLQCRDAFVWLIAEVRRLRADVEWRKEQMEKNWPRNKYGSLLTVGEWEAVQDKILGAPQQDGTAPQ